MPHLANRNTIVVGVDGTDVSLSAARWAAAIAERARSPLVLVHAVSDSGRTDRTDRPAGEQILLQATAFLRRWHPRLPIESNSVSGEAESILVDLSAHAAMTVVGAGRDGTVGSLSLGSTALAVANGASSPVAVWRGENGHPVRHRWPVVVGVDGNPETEPAIAEAFELAALFGVPIIAVHTWISNELPYPADISAAGDAERENALLAECLAGWTETFPDVVVKQVSIEASPADVLLNYGSSAAMVVVGSHAHNRLLGALLGSTSQRLLRNSACPVLICRLVP